MNFLKFRMNLHRHLQRLLKVPGIFLTVASSLVITLMKTRLLIKSKRVSQSYHSSRRLLLLRYFIIMDEDIILKNFFERDVHHYFKFGIREINSPESMTRIPGSYISILSMTRKTDCRSRTSHFVQLKEANLLN